MSLALLCEEQEEGDAQEREAEAAGAVASSSSPFDRRGDGAQLFGFSPGTLHELALKGSPSRILCRTVFRFFDCRSELRSLAVSTLDCVEPLLESGHSRPLAAVRTVRVSSSSPEQVFLSLSR